MNQILENKKSKIFSKKIYIVQFVVYICFILFFLIYFFHQRYVKFHEKNISSATIKSYSIFRLYSNYNKNNFISNDNSVSILGTISIPKINIEYPILSTYSDELLKISVCKFYGPEINHIGNFCILGHNYNTDEFFGNINSLKCGDIIKIYDNKYSFINYAVYNVYEVLPNDLSYIFPQSQINTKEITLITCDNTNRKKINCKSKRSRYLICFFKIF